MSFIWLTAFSKCASLANLEHVPELRRWPVLTHIVCFVIRFLDFDSFVLQHENGILRNLFNPFKSNGISLSY